MLLDIPKQRLELLKQLMREYRLFLFSNNNSIHYKQFQVILQQQQQLDAFNHYFEKQYYSHLLQLAKPDARGFLLILQENKLCPEETIFVDDVLDYVQAAKKLGMQTFHVQAPITILDLPDFLQRMYK